MAPMLVPNDPPKSNQDAFNRIWKWFVTDGHAKAHHDSSCFYRTPDGLNACGVGCLLPDDLPDLPSIVATNHPIGAILDESPQVIRFFSKVSTTFLSDVQRAHDGGASLPEEWPESIRSRLEEVARDFQLTVPDA